jgi:predicted GNAT family acetyltransferase
VSDPTIEVLDVPERSRFEVRVDGRSAGHAEYVRKGSRLIFTHTEIDGAYEGQGLGSRLVRGALDAARASGDPVVPLCPFVEGYLGKHPEYADVVDDQFLEFLGGAETRTPPAE